MILWLDGLVNHLYAVALVVLEWFLQLMVVIWDRSQVFTSNYFVYYLHFGYYLLHGFGIDFDIDTDVVSKL